MITIRASGPALEPPTWAVLQRRLFKMLNRSVYAFLEKYTLPDGEMILPEAAGDSPGRGVWQDSLVFYDAEVDDFYEPFHNWPLLYVLGGDDHLLHIAHKQWNALTRQMTELGLMSKEYEYHYDWFHQGEGNLFFYFLCLADPENDDAVARARRFAGFYLNEDPDASNYDPTLKLIRSPHNGSKGPNWRFTEGDAVYAWTSQMAMYGLPYHDVPGITSYDDLKSPALARRMGAAMRQRMGRGDVPGNLAATSLITNAYLITGDEKYRQWVIDYVHAWVERADRNGGLLPDNVGLSGEIGEYIDGKWYGGLQGWTWTSGFYTIGMAAIIGSSNAFLLSRNERFLALMRTQIDRIIDLGKRIDMDKASREITDRWREVFQSTRESNLFPYRYGDHGWFDYQPMAPLYPVAVWNLTLAPADEERVERLRTLSGYDWRQVSSASSKGDRGHEAPWVRFLEGDNPGYPELILRKNLAQVRQRLDEIQVEPGIEMIGKSFDWQEVLHHGQLLNPVFTEALVQLTLGAPQPIYNGGLVFAPVRYFDATRRRPGLPADVAALVTRVSADEIRIHLVNLHAHEGRDVVLQAGMFGEHQFTVATWTVLSELPISPGSLPSASVAMAASSAETSAIEDAHVQVHLPAGRQVDLALGMKRFVNQPTYAFPWSSRGR